MNPTAAARTHSDNLAHPASEGLLQLSAQTLEFAAALPTPARRFSTAYLAALRAAAAVVADRAHPRSVPNRPSSIWVLLADLAPELGEWAQFFAAGAGKRAAADAGLDQVVSRREADDLIRDAAQFLHLARRSVAAKTHWLSPHSPRAVGGSHA